MCKNLPNFFLMIVFLFTACAGPGNQRSGKSEPGLVVPINILDVEAHTFDVESTSDTTTDSTKTAHSSAGNEKEATLFNFINTTNQPDTLIPGSKNFVVGSDIESTRFYVGEATLEARSLYPTSRFTVPDKQQRRVFIVQEGNELWEVSRWSNTKISMILEMNPKIKHPDLIYPGQHLSVLGKHWHVQKNDVLGQISENTGVSIEMLLLLNPNITDRHLIYIGQKILVVWPHANDSGGFRTNHRNQTRIIWSKM